MRVKASGMSDIGRKRGRNEDSYLVNPALSLFLVADGMGGHSGGEFASRFASNTIEEVVRSIMNDPESTVISGVNSDGADFGDKLRYAIQVASQKIHDQAMFDQQLRGMGTTIAAVIIEGDRACIANVGDSRVYLVRDGAMKQMTLDHSLVSEQMRAGIITPADAKKHKFKNIITRSVGYQEDVEIDMSYMELLPRDKYLLCTDGLTNLVEDGLLLETLLRCDVETACRELIQKANERGGDDNVTVVVCEILAG